MADTLRGVAEGKADPPRVAETLAMLGDPPPIDVEAPGAEARTSVMPPTPSVPETLMEATITPRKTAPPRLVYAVVGGVIGLGIFLLVGGFLLGRARFQREPEPVEVIAGAKTVSEPAAPAPVEPAPLIANSADLVDGGGAPTTATDKPPAERAASHERPLPAKPNEKTKPRARPGEPDYGF
jgi:hypothetical protein